MTPPAALAELAAFSARLGRDPEQVQAAGGNTSLKEAGLLWVKASGLWLAEADQRPSFVPVRLAPVLAGIEAGAADPVTGAVVAELNPAGLRPSIETTLHALLPHPIVVHTHSVRTIALAIRADAETELGRRLAGLAWAFLPYRQPGLPLTLALAEQRARQPVDIVVLGNHGLVVGAESIAAAAALLAAVEQRLDAPAQPVRPIDPSPLADLGAALGLRPVSHELAHQLAAHEPWQQAAMAGSLYPDHVIFLGPAAAMLPATLTGPAAAAAVARASARGQKLFIRPGAGVLVPAGSTASADELALCLSLVLGRLPASAQLAYLGTADEAALLNWDAERYRQALDRARA